MNLIYVDWEELLADKGRNNDKTDMKKVSCLAEILVEVGISY